jgi:hypothetical protein
MSSRPKASRRASFLMHEKERPPVELSFETPSRASLPVPSGSGSASSSSSSPSRDQVEGLRQMLSRSGHPGLAHALAPIFAAVKVTRVASAPVHEEEVVEEVGRRGAVECSSLLKKRRTKMNKHKRQKRARLNRDKDKGATN